MKRSKFTDSQIAFILRQASRALDAGAGKEGEVLHQREVEKLHAKIGELMVERDFLAKRSGMSSPDPKRCSIAATSSCRSGGNVPFWAVPALGLMRRLDQLFTAWLFLGSRRMAAILRGQGLSINCKRAQR